MVLEKIEQANDIKKLNPQELEILAGEIREFLIEKISKTGGHLASNLGVVELTMALHLAFQLPEDKIIWDVGHQSYTHKILTGRREGFEGLRKYGGMSGFPKRRESDCDAFGTGHSSTSISAGLGYAHARDIRKKNYKVVSVIGDGALTGGMAFEALNNATRLEKNFIIVLKDNNMSISENVGGLSNHLNRLRTAESYHDLKEGVMNSLAKIPVYGDWMVEQVRRAKSGIKQLVIPGMIYENMGITYLGPVDGHNIEEMVRVFKDASKVDGPVMVHCLTQKGRGYLPAERHPARFHGAEPFDIATGLPKNKRVKANWTDVFSTIMRKMGDRDPKVVAVTAAMEVGTGLKRFHSNFPDRFFDVGIAEEHAISMAAGMAKQGLTPVVAIYSSFLQRAYDQLIHDTALSDLHVVFAVDRAGMVGADGETHHGIFDATFLSEIPNMTVLCPSNFAELRTMLDRAVNEIKGPVAIRYPRGGEGNYKEDSGRQNLVVLREGEDITLCAYGTMINNVLDAAEILHEQGIEARVVKINAISPLYDRDMREVIGKTKAMLVAEECAGVGCMGQRMAAILGWNKISPERLELCNLGKKFPAQGTVEELYREFGLDAESLAKKAAEVLR